MTATLSGLHHITAMCGDPNRNLEFYIHGLGLRVVKRTVNFEDPTTYHFYYGDADANLGSILTFFPWPQARPGKRGKGETAAFAYGVSADSLAYWEKRLAEFGARQADYETRFGATVAPFEDPDGMWFELIVADRTSDGAGPRAETDIATETDDPEASGQAIPAAHRLGLFQSATMWVAEPDRSIEFMQNVLGWDVAGQEQTRTRLMPAGVTTSGSGTEGLEGRQAVDIVQYSGGLGGVLGPGSIHHIAFRAADLEAQAAVKENILRAGIPVTVLRDRHYFQSIYFREPGGVLFEIATDGPGFWIDESPDAPAQGLHLPPWFEPRRQEIEAGLPPLSF